MNKRIKQFLSLLVFMSLSYLSWNSYYYFFSVTAPEVHLTGVDNEGYYAGEVTCMLAGNDAYNVATLSALLDDKPLIEKTKINTRTFEQPLAIQTKELSNGNHTLKVEVVNGTYAGKTTSIENSFFVDNEPLQAALLNTENDYKIHQGRTLHLKFQVNKMVKEASVEAFNTTYMCFPETHRSQVYECFIPIACEEKPNEHMLSINIIDLVGNTFKLDGSFQVAHYEFKRQQLKVDQEKVKKEKEIGLSNEQLEVTLQELAQKSPKEKLWQGVFYPPTEVQRISTEYGAIRVTQEKGRYMHKAVDILNLPKSVVWAPQNGVVVLKDRYALSGNTVVIDHGHGILSLFYHLDDFAENLTVGIDIKRGNPLGTLGQTGYASGYHLHWELRVNNIPVDPMQWTKANF